MHPRSFRIARSQQRANRVLVFVFAAGGALMLGMLPFLDDLSPADHVAAGLVVVGCAGAGAWLVRRGRRLAALEVILEEAGLRARSAHAPEQRLAWNEVHAIRDRVLWDRVDVATVGDAVRIELPYELDGFESLLHEVVAHTPHAQPARPLPAVLGSGPDPRVRLAMGGISVVGLGAALLAIADGNPWMALVGVSLVAGVGVILGLAGIRSLEIDAAEIRVVRALRSRSLPVHEIARVHLSLRNAGKNAKILEVLLERRDGKPEWVRPMGADLVEVYRTLASAVPSG